MKIVITNLLRIIPFFTIILNVYGAKIETSDNHNNAFNPEILWSRGGICTINTVPADESGTSYNELSFLDLRDVTALNINSDKNTKMILFKVESTSPTYLHGLIIVNACEHPLLNITTQNSLYTEHVIFAGSPIVSLQAMSDKDEVQSEIRIVESGITCLGDIYLNGKPVIVNGKLVATNIHINSDPEFISTGKVIAGGSIRLESRGSVELMSNSQRSLDGEFASVYFEDDSLNLPSNFDDERAKAIFNEDKIIHQPSEDGLIEGNSIKKVRK